MKPASLKEIRTDLLHRSPQELIDICIRLTKFKKENKELLTYLLFESENEEFYVSKIKTKMEEDFSGMNTSNFYFIRKSVRKILKEVKKFIRFSNKKETEVELLLHFCFLLKDISPSYKKNKVLTNTFHRQLQLIQKSLSTLHEDLQYDYQVQIEKLID